MPEIDADAAIKRRAQELEVTDEEFKVTFRGRKWLSRNPYNWPADWMDALSEMDIWEVLTIAFSEEQVDEMRDLEPPLSMGEAMGLISALQESVANEQGKSRRSGRSSTPTRNTSRRTSTRTTKSTSSTSGGDG